MAALRIAYNVGHIAADAAIDHIGRLPRIGAALSGAVWLLTRKG